MNRLLSTSSPPPFFLHHHPATLAFPLSLSSFTHVSPSAWIVQSKVTSTPGDKSLLESYPSFSFILSLLSKVIPFTCFLACILSLPQPARKLQEFSSPSFPFLLHFLLSLLYKKNSTISSQNGYIQN